MILARLFRSCLPSGTELAALIKVVIRFSLLQRDSTNDDIGIRRMRKDLHDSDLFGSRSVENPLPEFRMGTASICWVQQAPSNTIHNRKTSHKKPLV